MRQKLTALAKDASQIYLAQVVGVAVSFGISIVVARKLGADGRGAYGWIMSLFFLAIQFGQLGTDTLNRRMGATHPAWRSALAGNSVIQAVVLGSLAALAMMVYGWMQPVGRVYWIPLFMGLAVTPLMVLLGMWNGLGTGMGHARMLARTELIQRFAMVAVIGGLLLLGVTFKVWHLMAALMIAVSLALGYAGWHLHHLLKGKWTHDVTLFRYEAPLIVGAFGAGLCAQLMQRVDLLMLAAWRPLAESGYYSIALTLMDAMLMLPGAIGFMLLPKLAQEKNRRERNRFLLVVLGAVMGGMAIMCGLAAWLSPWFIPLLFGDEFVQSVPVFQRLLMAGVVVSGFTVCQNAVAGVKRARYVLVAPIVGVAVKVALGWWLVPHGVLAAANVNVFAYGIAFVVALGLVLGRRKK